MNPEKRERLPGMAFAGFVKRFVAPELSEGFQDITPVEFRVCFEREVFLPLLLCPWSSLVSCRLLISFSLYTVSRGRSCAKGMGATLRVKVAQWEETRNLDEDESSTGHGRRMT